MWKIKRSEAENLWSGELSSSSSTSTATTGNKEENKAVASDKKERIELVEELVEELLR